jgi:hypothetical protein
MNVVFTFQSAFSTMITVLSKAHSGLHIMQPRHFLLIASVFAVSICALSATTIMTEVVANSVGVQHAQNR